VRDVVVEGWAIVGRDVVSVETVVVPVVSTDTVVVPGDAGTVAGVHEADITTATTATNAPHLRPFKYLLHASIVPHHAAVPDARQSIGVR
jgi:hypothetical protein